MNRVHVAAAGFLLSLALGTSLTSQPVTAPADAAGNGHFRFALIGDMPYGAEGDLKFPNVV